VARKTDAAQPAPKKSKKRLLILVLGVLLLGGSAGGFLLLGSGDAEAEPAGPEAGVVVPLDAVTINLADGHYLKVKMSLQATVEAGEEEIDGSRALDAAIGYFSNMEIAELSSTAGRDKAKHELVERIGEAYEGHIMDLYFTEFVMQ
jgi:flagellar FliL protein